MHTGRKSYGGLVLLIRVFRCKFSFSLEGSVTNTNYGCKKRDSQTCVRGYERYRKCVSNFPGTSNDADGFEENRERINHPEKCLTNFNFHSFFDMCVRLKGSHKNNKRLTVFNRISKVIHGD